MASKTYELDDEQLKKFHREMGERIKNLRKQKGYKNHEKFANDHDFARAQYNKYEKGVGMNFTSIVKVAAAMGVSLKEFFSQGFSDFDKLKDDQ